MKVQLGVRDRNRPPQMNLYLPQIDDPIECSYIVKCAISYIEHTVEKFLKKSLCEIQTELLSNLSVKRNLIQKF